MHRPISVYGIDGVESFKDVRAPEVRQLLGSFDKSSYVAISNSQILVLTDNSVIYDFHLKLNIENRMHDCAFQIAMLDYYPQDELLYEMSTFDFVFDRWDKIAVEPYEEVANVENLRGNPEFESLIAMKAAEGMHYFKLPRFDIPGKSIMIPIFSGFPKLSKPDTIGVIVRIDPNEQNLVVNFKIFKKNINRNIDMYFRILDI